MENTSGITPLEDKVLVLPDEVSDKAGMIVKPDMVKEKESLAQTVATLIACGPNAFEEWEEPRPKPGDIVYVTKYAGCRVDPGEDGKTYQIVVDRDLTAIVTEGFRKIQADKFKGTRQPLWKEGFK